MLMNQRENKIKYLDEIQMLVNQVNDEVEQIEQQFSMFKQGEKLTRQKLQTKVTLKNRSCF